MALPQSITTTILTILLFLSAYLYYLKSSLDASFLELTSDINTASSSVKLLETIPKHVIPTPDNGRRLIVVGDIHGMSSPLDALLDKLNFDPAKDHLVTTGDMISKGPDSGGVVDKLIALNASAVRGNHEDHVLKARAKMDRRKKKKNKKKHHSNIIFSLFNTEDEHLPTDEDFENAMVFDDNDDIHELRSKHRDRQTARSLKKRHVKWLQKLPVILSLEPVLPIYIVHAGLVPGVRVRKQDPWAVMNMRTLRYPKHRSLSDDQQPLQDDVPIPSEDSLEEDLPQGNKVDAESRKNPVPTDGRSGQRWADAWNKYQHHISKKKRRAVIYGHDAKRGHRVGEYTFGLDSGCVVGGKLTAVVLEGGAKDGDYKHTSVQISC